MRSFACHGIFVWLVRCFAGENIDLWIVGHHALVHAVEGEALSVGTPERAFVDAEFITVD